MRYEPEHKEQTRQKVLRAATRAIRAEGPHKVAVAEVMACRRRIGTHGRPVARCRRWRPICRG
jgi:hypothetical protein